LVNPALLKLAEGGGIRNEFVVRALEDAFSQIAVLGRQSPSTARRRIVMRMPRLQVYLPDDLYQQLKARGLPASELLQTAVRAELERQRAIEAADHYVEGLVSEVGAPTEEEVARADAIVRKVRDRNLTRAG
jgi:post-segregation antitoxin (ccd killing protein)